MVVDPSAEHEAGVVVKAGVAGVANCASLVKEAVAESQPRPLVAITV